MKITVERLGSQGNFVKLRCDHVPPESFRIALKGRGWRWKKPPDGPGYWLGESGWVPTSAALEKGYEVWIDGVQQHSSPAQPEPSTTPPPPTGKSVSVQTASTVPEPNRSVQKRRVFVDPVHTSQRPLNRNFLTKDGRSVLDWAKELDYEQLRHIASRYQIAAHTTYRRSEIILECENLCAAVASGMSKNSLSGDPHYEEMVNADLDTLPEEVSRKRLGYRDLPPSLQFERQWRKFLEDGGQVNKEVTISQEQLADEVNRHVKHRANEVMGLMEEAVTKAAESAWDPDAVKKQTTEAVERAAENARPIVYHIKRKKKTTALQNVVLPDCFGEILRKASIGMSVMLVGPTGCGKTFVGEQVAKALELRFGALSCSIGAPDSALTGLLLPTGSGGKFNYVASQFVDFYENGGTFLIDEIDNSDANWLVLINMALSGTDGFFLPQRYENPFVKRHENFVCLAAANTFGTGTDLQYVGRSQLDESTLDRFRSGMVFMDYDPRVEESLVDPEVLKWGQEIRKKLRSHKLRRNVSTRVLQEFSSYKRAYPDHFSMKEEEKTFMLGWSEDEKRKACVA